MKQLKQIFNDMTTWWEEKFSNKATRNIVLWTIILVLAVTLYLVLLSFPASAVDLPEHNPDGSPTNLTGTTWLLDLKSEDFNNIGIFDVDGVANFPVTQSSLPIQEFTTVAFGYNYNEGQYTPMVGSCACVYDSIDRYNYWFDQGNGTVCLTFHGGDDVENTSLISALVTYADQVYTPTNLTGYTVTVPAGWTATAGYGRYHLEGSIITDAGELDLTTTDNEPYNFGIGYKNDGMIYEPFADYIGVHVITHSGGGRNLYGGISFTVAITGGSDVTNASLIQWFVDNNATFELTEPDEPPTPALTTFTAGNYYFKGGQGITDVTIPFSIPFLSASQYFNSITISSNNSQYSSMSYSIVNGENLNVWDEQNLWDNSSVEYSVIYLQADIELSGDAATVFSEYFVPLSSDLDLNTIYNAGLSNGESFGYSNGYDTGYLDGFNNGVDNSGSNFFGNFIEGILNALDKLVILPGGISILDIIKTIGGLFVVVWLLKLLAGG